MEYLRNLPTDEAKSLQEMIQALPGRVISMALSKSEGCHMTMLAFGQGESVSEEQYFGDTLYYVIEGKLCITIDQKDIIMQQGECLAVPGNTLHAIYGVEAFKILQITLER